MSALKFLSKKSWHTSTIRNNEKVWLKEQDAAKEKARIDELQKQLAEERKLEEVQRLEIESGRLDPAEVLKRRRLNWMYEHAAADQPGAAKEAEEKERDDLLLGKKAVDLEKVAKAKGVGEGHEQGLVDVEAKMREDPLFEIEREKARAGMGATAELAAIRSAKGARSSSKQNEEELAAKKARKEQRKAIREHRQWKREQRASLKRERFDGAENMTPKAAEHCLQKLPHSASPGSNNEAPRAPRYGLLVPRGGSGVAVTSEFVPHRLGESRERNSHGVRSSYESRRPPRPRQGRVTTERRKLAECKSELEKMEANAARLRHERQSRTDWHCRESRRESEAIDELSRQRQVSAADCLNDPARSFARDTMSRGDLMASRIQQRRAWATNDSNATY